MELRKKFPQTTFFKQQRAIKKGIAKKPESVDILEDKLKDQKGDLIDPSLKSRIYFPYGSEKLKRLRLAEKDSKLKVAQNVDISNKISSFSNLRILPTTRKLLNDLIIEDTVLKELAAEDIKCSDIQADTIYKMSTKIYTPESKQYLRDYTERQKQLHLHRIALEQNFSTGSKVEDLVIDKLLRNEKITDITIDEETRKNIPDFQDLLIKPTFNNKIIVEDSKYPIYNTNIFTIAAETGSGKTLSYLAPLIDYLQIYKNHLQEHKEKKDPIVRSIIFQPSNELILQVYNFLTLKETNPLNLNIIKLDSSVSPVDMVKILKRSQQCPIDILICSPDKIGKSLLKYDSNLMKHIANHLEWCIIDESDSLLDLNGSLKELTFFLNRCKRINSLVTCSATISELFLKNLKQLQVYQQNNERHFIITTDNLHKINKNLKLYNIDCSLKPFLNDRNKAAQQTIYSIYQKNKKDYAENAFMQKVFNRIIIFVNKKSDVTSLTEYLKQESNFSNIHSITSDLSLEERSAAIKPFIEIPELLENEHEELEENTTDAKKRSSKKLKPKYVRKEFIADSNIAIPTHLLLKEDSDRTIKPMKNDEMQILITTDLLARGLNFKKIKNLILFSPPQTSSDFIHRCGRICRLGDVGYSKNYYNSQIKSENDNKTEEGGRVYLITDKKESKKQWIRELVGVIKKGKSFV
ncbi:hypothetical protein QEN19_000354 [Hanseniaspora menglaensis]